MNHSVYRVHSEQMHYILAKCVMSLAAYWAQLIHRESMRHVIIICMVEHASHLLSETKYQLPPHAGTQQNL